MVLTPLSPADLSPSLLSLLQPPQFEGVLLALLEAQVAAQPHQEAQAVHTLGEPGVDQLVAGQRLLVAAYSGGGIY